MSASGVLTFRKEERICRKTEIDKLFNRGGSRSMAAFPVRLVYLKTDAEAGVPGVRVLVSVSKKCFKRAVKRNRVKRQLREAFRLNKSILYEQLEQQEGTALLIALIWIDDKLWPTSEVEKKVVNLMHRLSEKIERQ